MVGKARALFHGLRGLGFRVCTRPGLELNPSRRRGSSCSVALHPPGKHHTTTRVEHESPRAQAHACAEPESCDLPFLVVTASKTWVSMRAVKTNRGSSKFS